MNNRWYVASFAAALAAAAIGPLVWLADPVRAGGWYWIDLLEALARACALIPLCWTVGAYRAWSRTGRRRLGWLRLPIAAGGLLASGLLLAQPERLGFLAWTCGLTAVIVLLDAGLEERARRKVPFGTLGFAAIVLLLGAALLYPTPYSALTPGFTLNMNRYAHVEGGQPQGSLAGVLVIERPAFPVDWLVAALFPRVKLEKRDTSIPISEIQRQVHVQRAGANEIGTAVALQKLGLGQGVLPQGVQVLAVQEGGPAENRLKPGDLLLSVDGRLARTTGELAERMADVAPGEDVQIGYERGGGKAVAVIRSKASADDSRRAVLGIQVQDRTKADLTRGMEYRSYLAYQGGPSHGAMLALTVIDQLTPGGIAGGNRVAGTGTIDAAGRIGRIGGIEQKAFAVQRAGADVFFVPVGQEADARKGAERLNIVPVATLDDMLAWLKAHPKR
ncbi:PDZ domain-containing protein [Paenibacillus albicereus]|uniref:PDZ domain-containing protein n=1 Tax=Paenibacillus albicereus TaxID=2726185 RepID=A0A6H2GXI1_9BACL|nr:PDZ domain-containing protein [Paenibacillus albicereus]QJC52134.1 PDZ domain-containing protein [Paenibacillus albicereus]